MNDDVVLVYLVKDYPNLYDPSHSKYFDNTSKDTTWDEIGRILEKNADECRNKWKSLRQCYRKALRKRESKKMRPWCLESEMEFIRPFVAIQKDDESGVDTRDETVTDEEANPEEPSQPHQDVTAVYVSETSPNRDSNKSEVAKRSAVKRPAAEMSNNNASSEYSEGFTNYLRFKRFMQSPANFAMSSAPQIRNPPLKFSHQSDNLSKYFQVIEETVRTLPKKLQIKAKAGISKIVYDAEYEALEAQRKKVDSPKKQPSPSYGEKLKSPVSEIIPPPKFFFSTSSDDDCD